VAVSIRAPQPAVIRQPDPAGHRALV
jgi:hypothetical protein